MRSRNRSTPDRLRCNPFERRTACAGRPLRAHRWTPRTITHTAHSSRMPPSIRQDPCAQHPETVTQQTSRTTPLFRELQTRNIVWARERAVAGEYRPNTESKAASMTTTGCLNPTAGRPRVSGRPQTTAIPVVWSGWSTCIARRAPATEMTSVATRPSGQAGALVAGPSPGSGIGFRVGAGFCLSIPYSRLSSPPTPARFPKSKRSVQCGQARPVPSSPRSR